MVARDCIAVRPVFMSATSATMHSSKWGLAMATSTGYEDAWTQRLDVVNCAWSIGDVRRLRAYQCPTTGGMYAHQRSRFFGAYKNKTVPFVAEIEALVELSSQ